jgi:hypothetical protein
MEYREHRCITINENLFLSPIWCEPIEPKLKKMCEERLKYGTKILLLEQIMFQYPDGAYGRVVGLCDVRTLETMSCRTYMLHENLMDSKILLLTTKMFRTIQFGGGVKHIQLPVLSREPKVVLASRDLSDRIDVTERALAYAKESVFNYRLAMPMYVKAYINVCSFYDIIEHEMLMNLENPEAIDDLDLSRGLKKYLAEVYNRKKNVILFKRKNTGVFAC